jgi:hypothetical protein
MQLKDMVHAGGTRYTAASAGWKGFGGLWHGMAAWKGF